MAVRKGTSHVMHGILTLCTFGFWIPVWITAGFLSIAKSYKCSQCGLSV